MENYIKPEHLERIKRFRLLDDTFFAVCFANDTQLAEFVLRILLDKDDLCVISTQTQYNIKNLLGHSVTFDAYATDSGGVKYDIEIQRDYSGAIPQRARYHSSVIDGKILEKNDKYKNLPETYVIFITETDVIGDGLSIYHIERTITETGRLFNDGAHIIYADASHAKNLKPNEMSALDKLMHDFCCADPSSMYYDILSQKVRNFKENEKEVSHMCRIMEEMCEEVRQKTITETEAKFARERAEAEARIAAEKARAEERIAAEKARAEEKIAAERAEMEKSAKEKAKARNAAIKNAISMIMAGLKAEKISEYTSLPIEDVQELADLIV